MPEALSERGTWNATATRMFAVIAIGAKPILDEQVEKLDIGQATKDLITGAGITKENTTFSGEFRFPWEQGGFIHPDVIAEGLSGAVEQGMQGGATDIAANVRNVADQTFFNVGTRWVQAELVEVESPEIDETVEYGTDAYEKLVDELIEEGRGAMLAMRGEILIQRAGRNILVIGPSDPTP